MLDAGQFIRLKLVYMDNVSRYVSRIRDGHPQRSVRLLRGEIQKTPVQISYLVPSHPRAEVVTF